MKNVSESLLSLFFSQTAEEEKSAFQLEKTSLEEEKNLQKKLKREESNKLKDAASNQLEDVEDGNRFEIIK
jgi:RPA family protein